MEKLLSILKIVLAISYFSFTLAEPTRHRDNAEIDEGSLVVQLNNEAYILDAPDLEKVVTSDVNPRRPIKNARIVQAPAGTTGYKCFLTSSTSKDANKYASPLFDMRTHLTRPFKRADRLNCYNFTRDDVAHVLLETDKVDLCLNEVELSDYPRELNPLWINGVGRIHEVKRAHLLKAPSPRTACFLVSPERNILDDYPINQNFPLAWGTNPIADSIGCFELPDQFA